MKKILEVVNENGNEVNGDENSLAVNSITLLVLDHALCRMMY